MRGTNYMNKPHFVSVKQLVDEQALKLDTLNNSLQHQTVRLQTQRNGATMEPRLY